MRKTVSALGLVLGMCLAVPALSSCAAPKLACPTVGFIEHSDNLAAEITAYGTACSTATALVLAQRDGRPSTSALYGFRCVGFPVVPRGLAYEQFVCTGLHGRAVTWRYYY